MIYLKTVIKAILAISLIAAVIVVPKGLYETLNTDKITDEMYRRREKYFYGVITLWQIDSFEGGTGSRGNWLKNICAGFERQNNGVYINVETISAETAIKLIKSGQKQPDMVSYGAGTAFSEEYFEKLNIENLPDVTEAIREKAVPWCMGAYFVIGNSDQTKWGNDGFVAQSKKGSKEIFSMGVPERNGHDAFYVLTKKCTNSFDGQYALLRGTSQEIFELYNYSQRVNRMVGTQRDLYRLQALEKRELARQSEVTFLGSTDLFQYISVFQCNNEKKVNTMNDFIDYILKTEQQSKLGTIGMFPINFEAQPEYENSFVQMAWDEIKTNGIGCQSYLFSGNNES